MGYQMPIVCKEVYLPFESERAYEDDDSYSVAEYKEKFGIDLNEIFDVDTNGYVFPKAPVKLYVVLVSVEGLSNYNLAQPVCTITKQEDTGLVDFNGLYAQFTFQVTVENGVITRCGSVDNN